FQAADTLNAVHVGQINVHQHDFRGLFGEGFEGGLSIAVLTQATESLGAANDAGQSGPELFVILDNRHSDRHWVHANEDNPADNRNPRAGEGEFESASEIFYP